MAVIPTDALSVIQALTNNTLPYLAKSLKLFSNNCRVSLQWIPAKYGAQTKQLGANNSYQENAILTKALMMSRQEKDAYHRFTRPDHLILVRLRTGNNKWNARMHKKLKMVPPAASLFGG